MMSTLQLQYNSGKHDAHHILKPFAWALNALEGQLQHLKVDSTSRANLPA